jgi:hypothetical protein
MVKKKMENSYEYYKKVKAQIDAKSAFIGNLYY